MNETDGILGAPGTTYKIGPADGLEDNQHSGEPDTVELDAPTRISVDFYTRRRHRQHSDHHRGFSEYEFGQRPGAGRGFWAG